MVNHHRSASNLAVPKFPPQSYCFAQLHAGGSGQVAAYQLFKSPVEVEHIVAQAGLDIGDTSIGMHVKHVQIPVRPISKELGGAHVTALKSRPKLIGGERARYE